MTFPSASVRAASAIAIGTAAICAGLAAAAAETAGLSAELQEVVVTGSRIRRTDAETPSPVQLITREKIERSGQNNISDVIRSVSADNQGSLPTSLSAGFATGASGVSLRGLGLNSTLVLVNGRRMATYGLADDGSHSFVDLNSIPLEAVERIDIVKDGASAIYGSDAVAGVVNIILRDNYQGATLGATLGSSYKGDGSHRGFNGSFGRGDIASDRYNVFATIEYSSDDNINNANRPDWLGTSDLRPWGSWDNRRGAVANPNITLSGLFSDLSGPAFITSTPYGTLRTPNGTLSQRTNVLACPSINPATGVCLADYVNYHQIQPDQRRLNIYAKGSYRFAEKMTGYLEYGWFNSGIQSVGPPGAVSDSGVYDPSSPTFIRTHTTQLPGNHPDNPFGGTTRRTVVLSTTMFGGRNDDVDSTVHRIVTGLRGDISRWHYDVAAGHIRSSVTDDKTGFVLYSVLQGAINNLSFRVNPDLNSAALLASISPVIHNEATSSVSFFETTISGDLTQLPGGALGGAMGVEYRREKTDFPPNPYSLSADIVGLGYAAYSADRNVSSAYVELNAPIVKRLELDGAFRFDKYSDYGSSSTPKLGFKFTPVPQFTLRGTYSEAFRAPSPAENGKSASFAFAGIAVLSVGNPDIKPETAKSHTVGVIFEPAEHLSLSLDYYNIVRRNEIAQVDPTIIIAGTPSRSTPGAVIAGSQPGSQIVYDAVSGNRVAVFGPYQNLNKVTTNGLDIDLRHEISFANGVKLEGNLMWTRMLKFERVFPDGSRYSYEGTHGPRGLSSASGTPKDRGSLEFTLSKSSLSATARVNYVGGMRMVDNNQSTITYTATVAGKNYYNVAEGFSYPVADPSVVCGVYNPDGTAPNGCQLPSLTTLDLFGKWSFNKETAVTLGVKNVLNKLAPLDPYTYGGYNYNSGFHQDGAVGRFMTFGIKYKF